jgi:hypothetical protein
MQSTELRIVPWKVGLLCSAQPGEHDWVSFQVSMVEIYTL